MKMPTLGDAVAAISQLSGLGSSIGAAVGTINIIKDLFDGNPEDQAVLDRTVKEAFEKANASLDRLDQAIEEAQS